MVRFIINIYNLEIETQEQFTFQYGQIYYWRYVYKPKKRNEIYIPIWLDLL